MPVCYRLMRGRTGNRNAHPIDHIIKPPLQKFDKLGGCRSPLLRGALEYPSQLPFANAIVHLELLLFLELLPKFGKSFPLPLVAMDAGTEWLPHQGAFWRITTIAFYLEAFAERAFFFFFWTVYHVICLTFKIFLTRAALFWGGARCAEPASYL